MKNEKTSKRVARIAGKVLKRLITWSGGIIQAEPQGVKVCTVAELKALASALTQAADKVEFFAGLFDTPEGEARLTVNILRANWPREKVERFALHLLGEDWQRVDEAEVRELIAKCESLYNENAELKAKIHVLSQGHRK